MEAEQDKRYHPDATGSACALCTGVDSDNRVARYYISGESAAYGPIHLELTLMETAMTTVYFCTSYITDRQTALWHRYKERRVPVP